MNQRRFRFLFQKKLSEIILTSRCCQKVSSSIPGMIFLIILLQFSHSGYSQVTQIYSTNFGTTGLLPTGWTVAGTNPWTISNVSASPTPTFSGSFNVVSGLSSNARTITYSDNLSTVGYTDITVIWAARRTYWKNVTFYWSPNGGTNWYNLAITDVASNSTWDWVNGGTRISLPVGAEGVTDLSFYWSYDSDGVGGRYRMDDFSVEGCKLPSQPSVITGNTTPCVGSTQTYSVTNVSGITYNWSLPAGWTQTSGGTSNSITVTVGTGSGNISVTPINICGAGTTRSLAVTPGSSPSQPSSISGPVNPCAGSSATYSVTNVPGVTYTWSFPSGWIQTGGGNSNSVTVLVGAGSGTITVTPSNACGNGTPSQLSVSPVSFVPNQPAGFSGNTSPCLGSTETYSVTNVAGITFTWTFPGGWTIVSGQGTNSITVTVGASSGTITITPSNACGNGTAMTKVVSVLDIPAQPSAISGNSTCCAGTSLTYSVTNVPGLTYTWSFPSDWTITSGQGSNSVVVTVGATSGNVQVVPSNICGTGTAQSKALTVITTPSQPSAISGNSTACRLSSQGYSVTNVAGVTYTWTVPTGWTISSGQGSNSILVLVGSTSGNVTVTPSNSCGNGPSQTLAVTVQMSAPSQPSVISGNASPCQGTSQTYSVVNVSGITYSWSVPAGWSITSGQGTNSITVTVGSGSGNITVSPSNSCGGGASRILAVTSLNAAPAQPSAITGEDTVCSGSSKVYSVISTPFVTYTWTVPAGWAIVTGQGTASITVTAGATSGNITVTPSNSCGTGPASTKSIIVQLAVPGKPSSISGNSTPCEGSTQTYSVTAVPGVIYAWHIPAGWTVVSGQGSNSLTVVIGNLSGIIRLVPSNSCGDGSYVELGVTVSPLPASPGPVTGNVVFCEGSKQTYSVTGISGVTYTWTFPSGWIIVDGQGTSVVTVYAGYESGSVVVVPSNGCGDGPASKLEVTVNPKPAAYTGPDATLCVGASIQIGGPAVPGNTYSWTSDPAGFNSTQSDPTVTPAETTIYTLIEINPATGCSDTNSVTVVANQVINVSVNPASLTETVCSGEATNIQLTSNITGTVFTWIATLTGGTATTFNASGTGNLIQEIINNNSSAPAEVTYHVTATANECSNSTISFVVTVNPKPVVSNQTATVCSDVASGITLNSSTNGVAATTYSITSINSSGLTASAGTPSTGTGYNANVIADDSWTNTTTSPVNVLYTVVPYSSEGCPGGTFTVTLTINPEPSVTSAASYSICSGTATSINLTSNIPATFSYTIGNITGGITGATAGTGSTISQTLTNPGTTNGTVEYLVIPVSGSGTCSGNVFTVTVTVFPAPVMTILSTASVCSGSTLNVPLTANIPSSFSWTIGTVSGSITGATNGSGNTISQVLTNPSNSVAGTVQYIITPVSTGNSCTGTPLTLTVTVNPIPSVTASSSESSVCPGSPFDLFSSSNISSTSTIISENFNSPTNSWSRTNTSTGGTTGNAAWTLRSDGYVTNGLAFHSNDASQFYISDSRAQNGTVTATTLVSPQLSTVGYSNLNLSFYHYYDYNSTAGESAKVEVSTNNGASWTTVATYTNDRGSAGNFQNENINLGASYVNSTTFLLRFNYYCGSNRGRYWAIDNVTLTGTPIVTATVNWTSNPAGFTSTDANPANVSLAVTTQYLATYTNSSTSCSSAASVTVSAYPVPQPTITAEYCAVPGKIRLTAGGGGTYLWNTGETTQVIEVDVAGMYSVTVTNTYGCSATAYLSVSNELVVNGDFSLGNTGFTSGYSFDPTANGLYAPESEYAVNNNANYNHTNFWGYDHTSGTGTGNANFLIVNGAKYAPQPFVWRETVSVLPNTDYYFSAWAISLNNVSPYAELRFSVNGVQVGTTATLTAGQNIMKNPWLLKDRFYGMWNSGSATTAVIEILDLNTSANGNDFGIDDISFGTLAQIPFTINPSSSSGTYCEGQTAQLYSNITGGRPPIVYSWTGPGGFTSTQQDPSIPNISLAGAGTYYVTVTDGYGCAPVVDSVEIAVNPLPGASLSAPLSVCQWSTPPGMTFTGSDGEEPYTFTYSINGGATQTITTVSGSSVSVSVPTNVSGTFTYTILSVSSANGCSQNLNVSRTITVNSLPTCYITGPSPVCPNSEGNLYSGISGMNTYSWTISGSGTVTGPDNNPDVTVTAGDVCSDVFLLTLMATDVNGCNAICQEEIVVEDINAPVVSCPASGNTPAEAGETYANVSLAAPVIADNCAPSDSLLVSWSMSSPTAGSGTGIIPSPYVFNVGTTTVTYTVSDPCGNTNTCTFQVTVTPNDPPDITCAADINQGTDPGLCSASLDPGYPTINSGLSVSLSWSMSGATTGSGTGPIAPNPYTFNAGSTLITWIATNISGSDTCVQEVVVEDDEAPDFTPPDPQSYCVISLIDASYYDPTMDIAPDRPEYYILTMADKAALSPDPASYTDNCTDPSNLVLNWRIDYNGGVPASISGTGPLTDYTGDIIFPGAVSANLIHTITYWLVDETGNSSAEKTIQITITPRPNIIKQ